MLKKFIVAILIGIILILAGISVKSIKNIIELQEETKEVISTDVTTEKTSKTEKLEVLEEIKEVEEIENLEDTEIKAYIEHSINKNKLNENNFSFFYYNTSTGKSYFYNENKWYTAGSTSKVAIAMTYYDKINSGEISKTKTYRYYDGAYEPDSGTVTNNYKVGDNIPVSTLLEQMIVNSDNTATNILCMGLGRKVDYKKKYSKYTDDELTEDFYNSNIITPSIGYDFMKYLYDNSENYEELIKDMKKSSYGQYLKKYVKCDVAHKYGLYNGYVHDYGIVYGDTTYLIGVFTKNVAKADELIANINKDILEISENKLKIKEYTEK